MKSVGTLLIVVFATSSLACGLSLVRNVASTSAPTPTPVDLTDFDALNEWHSSDPLFALMQEVFRDINQQPPEVGHFAQACTLSRKVNFAYGISNEELVNRIRGEPYSTAYIKGIAAMLTEIPSDEQKEWCDKIVALYNFAPWFGNKIEW